MRVCMKKKKRARYSDVSRSYIVGYLLKQSIYSTLDISH